MLCGVSASHQSRGPREESPYRPVLRSRLAISAARHALRYCDRLANGFICHWTDDEGHSIPRAGSVGLWTAGHPFEGVLQSQKIVSGNEPMQNSPLLLFVSVT